MKLAREEIALAVLQQTLAFANQFNSVEEHIKHAFSYADEFIKQSDNG
jgi:hypothetical protein